jgi:hypothetical protein
MMDSEGAAISFINSCSNGNDAAADVLGSPTV